MLISDVLYLIPILLIFSTVGADSEEEFVNRTYQVEIDEFVKKLFSGYNPNKLPLPADGNALEVTMQLAITHLVVRRLDEPVVKFSGILTENWIDSGLGWNPADHNGRMKINRGALDRMGIWYPPLAPLQNGNNFRSPIQQWSRKNVFLEVWDKNHYQNCRIRLTHTVDGTMDCDVKGGFPNEEMNCTFQLYSKHFMNEVQLLTQEGEPLLKKWNDVADWSPVQVNGWLLTSSKQRIRVLNPSYDVLEQAASSTYKQNHRSVFEVTLSLRRQSPTLSLISLLPLCVSASWVGVAYLLPLNYAPPLLIAAIYFNSTILKDILDFVPIYNDSVGGVAFCVSYLWLATVWALLVHVLFLHFFDRLHSFSMHFICFLEYCPFFTRLEEHFLKSEKIDTLREQLPPAPIIYLRIVAAIGHCIFFIALAFF